MLALVLLIFALVFALLAATGAPSGGRLVWGWVAFLFYLLMVLVNRIGM